MDVTYLDYNSTTPVSGEVLKDLAALASRTFGNPSSLHTVGRESRHLIREALPTIAKFLACPPEDIHFTSGASESNSWALHSAAQLALAQGRKPRFLLSSLEHESTRLAAKQSGADAVFVRATPSGQLDLDDLRQKLRASGPWALLSVVHANNETGVIQPLAEAIAEAKTHGVPVHVDCAQTLARVPISAHALGADYLTFSGHKIGTLRGIGLLLGKTNRLFPLVHGKQQRGARGGTENTLGVVVLARILGDILAKKNEPFPERLADWHRQFEARLLASIDGLVVHGQSAPRLCNTSFIGFEGVNRDSIQMGLDLVGICASSGSACSSGQAVPSQVLLAMGASDAMARSSVRFSSGRDTTWQDFERVLGVLPNLVARARRSA